MVADILTLITRWRAPAAPAWHQVPEATTAELRLDAVEATQFSVCGVNPLALTASLLTARTICRCSSRAKERF